MGDREELDNLRRLAELEAKAAGNATTEPVAASQRDVRMAETPSPARARTFPGDAGASLSAAEAFGAANDLIDKLATKFGGFVTDKAAEAGAKPEGAAAAGTVAKMLPDLIPMVAGGVLGGTMKAPEMARTLMQSAVKPTAGSLATGKYERAADTMLERGMNASKGDMANAQKSINDLEQEVAQIIQNSSGQIGEQAVRQRIQSVFDKYRAQVNPTSDLAAIKKVEDEFSQHPMLNAQGRLSLQDAQAVKEGTYRAVGDKGYGLGLRPAAERDAQKALARGLKEEIEAIVPEVRAPNKEASDLINVLKVAAPRISMQANKNPAGLGWLLAPGSGTAETAGFLMWLAERWPYSKSLLANELNSGRAGKNLGRLIGGADSAALMFPEPPKRLEDVGRR